MKKNSNLISQCNIYYNCILQLKKKGHCLWFDINLTFERHTLLLNWCLN